MSQCYRRSDFKKYFKENMDALGLDVPTTCFETSEKAIETASLMLAGITAAGKGATVTQAFVGASGLQLLVVAGGANAAGYTGAVIGSILVASGRSISCGRRPADALEFINRDFDRFLRETRLFFDKWHIFYLFNEEIFNTGLPHRYNFRRKVETHDFDYSHW